jgi:hypothetical protein
MNKVDQSSLVEVSNKKWLENESDPQDNAYELIILNTMQTKTHWL